jgi:ATP-binding cassette, subfamily B (MDR/TAP), member 1
VCGKLSVTPLVCLSVFPEIGVVISPRLFFCAGVLKRSMTEVELTQSSVKDTSAVTPQPDVVASADQPTAATLSELFMNATPYDYLLMSVGTLGGIVTGVSIPVFNVLFGKILDKLNGDPHSFANAISQLCIDFVVVACANLLSGYLQVGFLCFRICCW